jgi:hypothetical protein
MNAKVVILTTLALTLVGLGAVRAQAPSTAGGDYAAMPPTIAGTGGQAPPAPQQFQVSGWIRGDKFGCCEGDCPNGPLQYELFLRVGPSFQIGGGQLADSLLTGIYTGGGGRLLLFDPEAIDAWVAELGVANIDNHAHMNFPGLPLNILVPGTNAIGQTVPTAVSFGKNGVPGVTVRSMDRTFLSLGGGKEWYLIGSAACCGPTWRIGSDLGGRWGTEEASFNEIPHRTDTIGGVYAALHSDVEIPCGCCILQGGCRVEYDYFWSDILQIQNKSDTQDINLLFTIGVRY